MSMTDPIADFLTRVRNAIHAAHETVDVPASKLKSELARILDEQGYIDSWSVIAGARRRGRPADPDPPEVHRGPPLGDLRAAARLAPRTAHLRRRQAHPQGARRHGHRDHLHLQRRDDRPRRARRRHRRRGPGAGLVSSAMSRIGRQPIPVPAGVTVSIEPESVRVNGPKGELSERIHRDIEVTQEGEQLLVTRPTDRGEHRALHGLTRTLVANMVQGVTARLREAPGDPGRRLPRAAEGQEPRARRRLLAPGADPARRRASNSKFPSRPASSSRASPSSSSARPPRSSASSARRSPTRARASATRASTCARKVGKRA